MKGIYIEPKDIQVIFSYSYSHACRVLRAVKDALGLKNITIEEFCKFERVSKELFEKTLINYKPTSHFNIKIG